jgi:hypothetical protein
MSHPRTLRDKAFLVRKTSHVQCPRLGVKTRPVQRMRPHRLRLSATTCLNRLNGRRSSKHRRRSGMIALLRRNGTRALRMRLNTIPARDGNSSSIRGQQLLRVLALFLQWMP